MKAQKLTTFLEHQGLKVENGSKVALTVVDDVVLNNPRILPEGVTIEAGKLPDGSEIIVLQVEKVSYDAGYFNYTNITDDVIEQAQRAADDAKVVEVTTKNEGVWGEIDEQTHTPIKINDKRAENFVAINGLDDFKSRVPAHAKELPWRNIAGGASEGVRYRWTDADGSVWDLRAHSIDPSAPAGSNASKGWIYRIEVRWGGIGKKFYMDSSGNFHPYNVTNPNSPMYNEVIANDTHIILNKQ